jgi:ribonuclease P protein subunit POP4
MSLSPETLPRHELVGLHVRVVESTDPNRVGIEGRVVRETMQTLHIAQASEAQGASATSNGGRRETSGERVVPKAGSTFEFRLDESPSTRRDTTDEAAAGRKAAGTASEPVSGETHTAGDGVAYVTVDGTKLLSRPALRTETGVDSKWQ